MKIELACDHEEGEEFATWLTNHGYDAMVGNTTHDFINGRDCSGNDWLAEMWGRYCNQDIYGDENLPEFNEENYE